MAVIMTMGKLGDGCKISHHTPDSFTHCQSPNCPAVLLPSEVDFCVSCQIDNHLDSIESRLLNGAQVITDRDYLPLPELVERFEEQGQLTCYQCEQLCNYIFSDGRCKDCTRLTPDEVTGADCSAVAVPVTPPLCPMGGTFS